MGVFNIARMELAMALLHWDVAARSSASSWGCLRLAWPCVVDGAVCPFFWAHTASCCRGASGYGWGHFLHRVWVGVWHGHGVCCTLPWARVAAHQFSVQCSVCVRVCVCLCLCVSVCVCVCGLCGLRYEYGSRMIETWNFELPPIIMVDIMPNTIHISV
jgi:hypothetical protein